MQKLKYYFDKTKTWIIKEGWLVFVSCIFLAFQWLISFNLWHRKGDIPPGFSDSLSYIYSISKVILHHNLFPYTFYLHFPAHFTYIGYNLFMGLLGILTGLSGEQIFHYSFFFGKITLLFSLIYFLKNLFKTEKFIVIMSLLFLGFFFGDGDIHGFYWVVPSFWMVLIFFILLGIIFSERKFSNIFLFSLAFFYITVHPMSSYSTVIFLFFTALCFFFNKASFKKSLKITTFLAISVLLFQATIFISSKYSYLFYKDNNVTTIVSTTKPIEDDNSNTSAPHEDNGSSSENSNQVQKIVSVNGISYSSTGLKNDNTKKYVINDSAPSISFKLLNGPIERGLTYISKYFPSAFASWNSYFSWFYRIPPLLLLLIFSIYSNFKKNRRDLLIIYFSCLFFSLSSLVNPFGERSIIFLFPITIIFLVAGVYDLYFIIINYFHKNNYLKLIKATFITLVILGTAGFAAYGVKAVTLYSNTADYKSNATTCLDYIKKKNPEEVMIYFSSLEGLNYFLSHGFDGYKLSGMNLYPNGVNNENIFIFENYDVIKSEDINMPLIDQDRLNEIINENRSISSKEINCGIFKLYDSESKNE